MLFFRKGFTLLEIIIVLALTALFIATTSYMNRDVRTYQTNAERLANHIDTTLRTAKSNMTLGRGVMSGSTLVATDKRTISIRGTGITTTYGTTNTGTENKLTWPFYDSDTAYQITDISVSSGILMNGHMPIWDQTGVTMADITVLPNGDFQIFSSSVATPIRILRITAGYAGFERSIMIDAIMGRTTSVQGRGEMDYIPAPPAPPPNSCAATPTFANIGTTNIGLPTTAGQGWYYSTTPGNCSYDCINGFKGASCLTPPTPSCDTNPAFPNLGILTTGSPSSVGQAWYYSATPGNCTYACSNGYTGNNCLTAPVNGCATSPTYPNIGTLTTGSPTTWNQAWTYNTTPGTCTYDCTGGYSGPSCATAPFVTNFTTTWKVGTAGYGNGDNIVRFSVVRSAGAVIDWGDGIIEPLTIDNPSHTYLVPGDFTITISNITAFRNYAFNNNYFGKLIAVNDWGGIAWSSMELMFSYADNLNQLPLGAPNMTNVLDIHGMFQYATSFNQSVANFDTSKVIYMYSMFMGATSFNQSVANFDTSKVVDIGGMFFSASSFNQSVANFNTSNVTGMYAMFYGASSFNQSISNFDTSKVTNMNSMFSYATSFNQSVANFNTSNVTNMGGMFMGAANFNQSISNFDTSKVTNMGSMFRDATVFNQSIANFNTSLVTDISYMFSFASSFNQSISNFDTSKVTNMTSMFESALAFNQSVSNFDTSKVTSMFSMFGWATSFNQSVANFDTSKVISMQYMFYNAIAFNKSVANFDTSKVTNMNHMFSYAADFNQDISNWCVSLIASKPFEFDLSGNAGFTNISAKQPQWGTCPSTPVGAFTTTWKVGTVGYGNGDNTVQFSVGRLAGSTIDWGDGTIEPLSTDNPSHVYGVPGDYIIKMSNINRFYTFGTNTDYAGKLTAVNDWGGIVWSSMYVMFAYANHLNQLPISAPNMTNVTDISFMFTFASIFNQSISNFNTSNVTTMRGMFEFAPAFNQSISNFNTSNVTNMSQMFFYASAFNQSVANFDTSNVTNMTQMFGLASAFNQSVANFDTSNVTSMEYMFGNATAFNQSVSNFDTSKVTNMRYMFSNATAFNQSVANFNTSNVTTMAGMFGGATNFNQSLANFDTSNVTDMYSMFYSASSFNQSLANFNTSNVTSMNSMFYFATNFNQSLANFDTSKVTNMGSMFYGATNFNQSLANFNTSNVIDMGSMFGLASSFNQSLANFDTSKVAGMGGIFSSATAFNQNISNWCVTLIGAKPTQFDLSGNAGFVNNIAKQPQWGTCPAAPVVGFTTTWKVGTPGYGNGDNTVSFNVIRLASSMIDWGDGTIEPLIVNNPSHTYAVAGDYVIKISNITAFRNLSNSNNSLGKLTIVNDWGGIGWTSMYFMFAYADHLNQLPVGAPNMTNVTSTFGMFYKNLLFNQSVANFNTSNVTDMGWMFTEASAFNQSVANFNTSNVTNMSLMFQSSAFNQSVANFDTSKVIYMGGMFNTTPFNQSVANFNTSNVTDMNGMFNSTPFNQSVANFDTTKVTNMTLMFAHNVVFNQSLANFNTSNVLLMQSMFEGDIAFNQPLSNFDTTKVMSMMGMFNGAASFNQDISGWCVSLIGSKPSYFDNSVFTSFANNATVQPQWGTCP